MGQKRPLLGKISKSGFSKVNLSCPKRPLLGVFWNFFSDKAFSPHFIQILDFFSSPKFQSPLDPFQAKIQEMVLVKSICITICYPFLEEKNFNLPKKTPFRGLFENSFYQKVFFHFPPILKKKIFFEKMAIYVGGGHQLVTSRILPFCLFHTQSHRTST